MFDPTKPYTRRDEKYAKIIYTKADGSLVVLDADEFVYTVFENGMYFTNTNDDCDLVNTEVPFDPKKPAQTKSEKLDVKFLGEIDNTLYPLAFEVVYGDHTSYLMKCTTRGTVYLDGTPHVNDLVNVTQRIKGWINFYTHSSIYDSHDDADKNAVDGRIACKFISFEEGEGL